VLEDDPVTLAFVNIVHAMAHDFDEFLPGQGCDAVSHDDLPKCVFLPESTIPLSVSKKSAEEAIAESEILNAVTHEVGEILQLRSLRRGQAKHINSPRQRVLA
jgi:hypothetical protein